jgi:hypothetical protein
VNGKVAAYIPIYWAGIQQANAVAGVAGVQAYLAPILRNAVVGNLGPYETAPVFIASGIPMPVMNQGQLNGTANFSIPCTDRRAIVICAEGMVGTWTA